MTAPPGDIRPTSADAPLHRPRFALTCTLGTAFAASLMALMASVQHVEGQQTSARLFTEVPCGTTAFRDLRHHCPSGSAAYCPCTRSVTIQNSETAPERLTVISGLSGHRSEQASVTICAE